MSEQAPTTPIETTAEAATTPNAETPAATGDRELNDADLNKVSGGRAAPAARKAGKGQQE